LQIVIWNRKGWFTIAHIYKPLDIFGILDEKNHVGLTVSKQWRLILVVLAETHLGGYTFD
jgi:hypothetical protein